MKRKSIKLMIITIILSTTFSTNIAYAAKPSFNDKNNNLEHKQDNYNKRISKEAYTLSERLDQIEKSYKKVNVKLEEYFNESNEPQSTTGSSINVDTPTQSTTDSSINVDVQNEDSTDTQLENTVPIVEGQSEEFEKEYENEDKEVSNSFYGKLNAIMNRLDTIKRQLNRVSSLDNEDISKINNRTDELINQVKASMDKLSNLQKQNVENLRNKPNKRTMETQKINEQKRIWKIHFNKSVNPETINSKNIMVVDSKNNIVDIDVSYNEVSKDVIIEAKDGFIKSESYSILIGDDVKAQDGKKLSRPIEKIFQVIN